MIFLFSQNNDSNSFGVGNRIAAFTGIDNFNELGGFNDVYRRILMKIYSLTLKLQ